MIVHDSPLQRMIEIIPNHTKPYQTKPYQISSLNLQLSITAISIHIATLPFSEDRDCKPFSACFIQNHFLFQIEDEDSMKIILDHEQAGSHPHLIIIKEVILI